MTNIERYLINGENNFNYFFGASINDNVICIVSTKTNGAFVFDETNKVCHQFDLYTENSGVKTQHKPIELHVLGHSTELIYCCIDGDTKKWYVTYPNEKITGKCPKMYPSKYISNITDHYVWTDILNMPIKGYVCSNDTIKRFQHWYNDKPTFGNTYNYSFSNKTGKENEIVFQDCFLNTRYLLTGSSVSDSITNYPISSRTAYVRPTNYTPVITKAYIGAYGESIDNSHAGFSLVFGGKGILAFSRQPENGKIPVDIYYILREELTVYSINEIVIKNETWVGVMMDNEIRLYKYDTSNDTIVERLLVSNLESPAIGIISYNRDSMLNIFIATKNRLIYTTDMKTYSIIKQSDADEEFRLLTQVRLTHNSWSTDTWLILSSTKGLYIIMESDPSISYEYSTTYTPVVCDGESSRTLLFGGEQGLYTITRFPGIYINLPIHAPTINDIHKRVIMLDENIQALTRTVNQMAVTLNQLAYNCQHILKIV